MYRKWPLGHLPDEYRRPEIAQLVAMGYAFDDEWEIISIFEQKVAEFAGSKYAVAVDCCSHGLFLALKYVNATGKIVIPKHTYVSVPMQIKHAGCEVVFDDIDWKGAYQLSPYPIYDGAMQWRRGMYETGTFKILSFQIKKAIPIGKGGVILTDDKLAYNWFKKACYDGRVTSAKYISSDIDMIGWHYYMTPEDAARGIILMDMNDMNDTDYPDRIGKEVCIDVTSKSVFRL
jgi:dTDP-4-amino-4,6-dideoxygalactose transaminase